MRETDAGQAQEGALPQGAPLDYAGALAYLEGLSRFGVRLGLERMRSLLEALGNPQDQLTVIHVAGTNGKGSTAAILAAILQSAGYRVGLYTSPHLVRYTERIQVNGTPIPPGRLAAHITRVQAAASQAEAEGLGHPTEFEAGTAAMYLYFLEAGVDVVIQETGLGGRLDATNLVAHPLAAIITPVDLDHTDRLGTSIGEIAREKAAIIKPGTLVVMAPQHAAARQVIANACREAGARMVEVGRRVAVEAPEVRSSGTSFSFHGLDHRWPDLHMQLLGRHQLVNAAAALAMVELLARHGWRLDEAAVRKGLEKVRWPGRLEIMQREPVVVLDGAHNPAGAWALRSALEDLFPGRRLVLVLGVLGDKDVDGVVSVLASQASLVVATRPDSDRALPPNDLAHRVQQAGVRCLVEEDPDRALARAVAEAGQGGVVCATGSLYLVGRLRGLWV